MSLHSAVRAALGHAVTDFGECSCSWHANRPAAALSPDQVDQILAVLVEIAEQTAGPRPELPPTVAALVGEAIEAETPETEMEAGRQQFTEFAGAVVALAHQHLWVPSSEEANRRGRESVPMRGTLIVTDDGLQAGAGTLYWPDVALAMFEAGVRVSARPRVGLHGTRVDWLEPGADRIEPQPQWVHRTSTYFWPVDGQDHVHGRHTDAWAGVSEFGERGPVWNRVLKRVETSTAIDGEPTVYVTSVQPFTPVFLDSNYAGARRVRGGQDIVARIRLGELSEHELGSGPHRVWFAGEADEPVPMTAEFVELVAGGGWSPSSEIQVFRLLDGSLPYATDQGGGLTDHFIVAVTVEQPASDTYRHADLLPCTAEGDVLGVLEVGGSSSVEQFRRSRVTLRPGMSTDDAINELLARNRVAIKEMN